MGLSQDLDWREVMSWYAVGGAAYIVKATTQQKPQSIDGATYIVRAMTQQEPWRIDACWRSSPHGAVAIVRCTVQFEIRDLGDDWPWWRWDPRGLFDDRYSERSVWEPNIEGSIPGGLTQAHSCTKRFV